jgi:ketosteroid isomerase-like protein
MTDLLELTKRFLHAIESGAAEETVMAFYAPDVVMEEFPNRFMPQGKRSNLAEMREAFRRGRHVMASQRYEVLNAVVSGNQVVVEFAWTGTLAVPVASLSAGSQMRARCVVFLEFRDGLIAAHRQYDCYDPW